MVGSSVLHYRITGKLGAGGMGIVWRAVDTRLGREVALKFLPDSATADPLRLERLEREAKAASALNHPNIVTIYEINADGDRHFIAMELIQGRPLSELLRGSKPFPVGETVGYMIQFCDGLAKAHAARIVHRDIKPSNIMLTEDGLIKILDFGLAKSFAEAASLEVTHVPGSLTAEGSVSGTLPYMSPEQASGEMIGPRSDVFSTGVVLYEMLAGRRPFDGPSRTAIMEAVLRADPRPLRAVATGVPEELAEIVHTCLRKAPEARYANAGELATHLRSFERYSSAVQSGAHAVAVEERTGIRAPGAWLGRSAVAIAVLAALLFGGYFALRARQGSVPVTATVIPSEILRNAQESLQRYDRKGNIDRAIALLEPAVTRDTSNAALHAALAEAYLLKSSNGGGREWLQKASDASQRAVSANPDLAAAHVAQGKTLEENRQHEQAALELQRALELDPLSSAAHVALARVRYAQGRRQDAGELYAKATQLAPNDWIPVAALGVFHIQSARYPAAIEALEHARTLARDNVVILRNLGPAYFSNGQFAEAATTLQSALELDQTMVGTWANLGTARYFQGQYSEALRAFRKAVDLAPDNYLYWGNLGDGHRWAPGSRNNAASAYAKAIAFAKDRLALDAQDTRIRSSLAVYLAKSGDTTAALNEITQVERAASNSPETFFKMAVVYHLANDRSKALNALDRAVRAGFSRIQIENEPELALLRADPGYAAILPPDSTR